MKVFNKSPKSITNLIITTIIYAGSLVLFVNHIRFNYSKKTIVEAHKNYIDQSLGAIGSNIPSSLQPKFINIKNSIDVISRQNEQMLGLSIIAIILSTALFGSFLSAAFEKQDPPPLPYVVGAGKTYNPDEKWQRIFNQFEYPVFRVDSFDNISWMNESAKYKIKEPGKLKKILNSLRASYRGTLVVRFNFKYYELTKTQISDNVSDGFLVQMVPMIQETSEFNQILTKDKMEARDTALAQLQPKLSQVVTDLFLELNFLFQASNTLVEIQENDTLLLVKTDDIKPYLKSFVLSIHQLIKDTKGTNSVTVSFDEIDERALLIVHVNKLLLVTDDLKYNSNKEAAREIFAKWNEIETTLSSRFCTISMRQLTTDKVPSCEFVFSFENIPMITQFTTTQVSAST